MLVVTVLYCLTGITLCHSNLGTINQAVQIATIETTGNAVQTRLDVDRIRRVVKENGIEDLPVVVIGIAGIARTGKSFLLNMMIEYLEHMSKSPGKPFQAASSAISGINWAGGRKGVTKGIWLWDKAYIIQRNDNSKVAILFFDTQGICDGVNSAYSQVDNQIIYMSLSMATIYIHNVDKNWKMPEKRIYQICKSFNDLYGEGSQNDAPLFNSFTILYRNWVEDEIFGIRPDIFYDEMKESELNLEASRIMRGINRLFHHKTAWVLPEPAEAVRKGQGSISLADVGKEFLDDVADFMAALFNPNGHYVNQMDGTVTGKTFIGMMEDLSERLKKWPDLPVEDQLKVLYLTKAFNSAVESFEEHANSIEHVNDIITITEQLNLAETSALERFKIDARNVKPTESIYSHYLDKLLKKLKDDKEKYFTVAEGKVKLADADKSIATLKDELKQSQQDVKNVKELEEKVRHLENEARKPRRGFTISIGPISINLGFGRGKIEL